MTCQIHCYIHHQHDVVLLLVNEERSKVHALNEEPVSEQYIKIPLTVFHEPDAKNTN